jgi:hypothetical protein
LFLLFITLVYHILIHFYIFNNIVILESDIHLTFAPTTSHSPPNLRPYHGSKAKCAQLKKKEKKNMLMTKADNPWVFSKTFDIVQIENLNF